MNTRGKLKLIAIAIGGLAGVLVWIFVARHPGYHFPIREIGIIGATTAVLSFVVIRALPQVWARRGSGGYASC